jgi:hypothetical protein
MDGQRHIRGVPGTILDTASLNVMLQSIGTPIESGEKVFIFYFISLVIYS